MGNFFHLWPVLLFLAFMLGVSFWVQRASRGDRQQNFAKDYFIGGRSLGGFVLAMTTVATGAQTTATFAQTAAQYGLNAALMACPLHGLII